ncbi:MAG: hypothetical protein M1131_01255 [Actinobacteria bacterium]|nr:hypothetical protein [Actinomycetota bacterium]MCL6094796.1 hypothetical protein [Actinomycetota bacterium]
MQNEVVSDGWVVEVTFIGWVADEVFGSVGCFVVVELLLHPLASKLVRSTALIMPKSLDIFVPSDLSSLSMTLLTFY